MSSADPAGIPPVPADAPNPLEIFFEKNKKWIYALAVLLVAAFAAKYGWQKLQEAKRDKEWRDFTTATGIDKAYGAALSLSALPEQYKQYQAQIWGNQIYGKQRELVTRLAEDVRGADMTRIDALITEDPDHARVPWLHWAAANKLYADGDWAGAKARCAKLQGEFGAHFLCTESPYPVQVREEKEDPDAEKKKGEEASKKKKKTEYVAPIAGSPVGKLLDAITKDEAFRASHARYFEAPEPDKSETAILKLAGVDLTTTVDIEIAFYPGVEKHVAAFKKNFADGYYKDMRIHKIKRARKDQPDAKAPTTIHLGNPASKEADREKWKTPPEAKDEDILEFETTETELSHFPMMVVAEQEKEGKSSARRFFICVNDCAAQYDGDYVIFGRVIRGQQYVKDIAAGSLADESEELAGEGRPGDDIRVEATELKKG